MQLSEILERDDIKIISKKTNISENSLEALIKNEFCYLKKVQCMGFISIIEREYKADLSALRSAAEQFYANHYEDCGVALNVSENIPTAEESASSSKKFPLILVLLIALGVAFWFFKDKIDTQKIKDMLPFQMIQKSTTIDKSLMIGNSSEDNATK